MNHRLLVRYLKPFTYAIMSFDDDDNNDDDDSLLFGQTIVPVIPSEVHVRDNYKILGSSHGLFCLYCQHPITRRFIYVIWNPSIRKSVVIKDPQTINRTVRRVSFGVFPVTRDPKLVRVNIDVDLKWFVEVYSLSSGSWRGITNKVPRGTINVYSQDDMVVTDRIIYWNATDLHNDSRRLVVSFDLTSEEFTLIDIPDYIADHKYEISKRRDSLVLLTYNKEFDIDKVVCDMWMMNNNGVSKTFTKLYNITLPNMLPYRQVRGFTKSGTPIIKMGNWFVLGGLHVFEPNSERFTKKIGTEEAGYGFEVYNYHEMLLLIDQSI
ncbi:F-box/kelch-repeat protein At3g06240-like [Rutidosis leptorrhynchoides]|uniref:F-box/kelch-repeat protein At3g06240-like n=1 Tax=Rutidosis leptorrhynchoides TaxID=125765 RepID=UPI003A9A6419